MHDFRLVDKTSRRLSHWAELVTRTFEVTGHRNIQEFHSLAIEDYVNVLAVTDRGEIPMVRQYRPALEDYSLELPGGLPDEGEESAVTAARELHEETGYHMSCEPTLLGCLNPDSGRLENRLWGYFAENVKKDPNDPWTPEAGVETILMSDSELMEAINSGAFVHALHIAIVGLAVIRGLFRFDN